VTTTSADAQRYFDQGVAFLSAFNHDEAARAFGRAAELDPSCAMAHWGVAMARGPHINNPEVEEEHARVAWAAVERARAVAKGTAANGAASSGLTKVESDLVGAIATRFADPATSPSPNRAALDRAYADAMRSVWKSHPADMDVAAWFAEALMNLRPWDYWAADGTPQPGTQEIASVLEDAMLRSPAAPMALHLYIHLQEASPHPEKADAAADRLRTLTPALGHLVHMPSHIDVRRGRWREAIEANERAIVADDTYRKRAPKQGFYSIYMAHNRHMLAFAAMMRGQSDKALTVIRAMVAAMDPEWLRANASIADGFLAMPLEVLLRFGRWEEILAAPEPDEAFPLTRALRHYARGVAYAAEGDVPSARASEKAFLAAKGRVSKDARFGNSAALDIAAIAEHVLSGEIAAREGKMDTAVAALRAAVQREDGLAYDEPPDWIMPVRHALGATLIRAGKPSDAETVYREDLRRHPDNGWSLFGLERALRMQGKMDDANTVAARFAKAWEAADVKLSSSCFCLPGI
jgi:tetratricopeptide (TPR) repeat protein